jgi:hypothetical protein
MSRNARSKANSRLHCEESRKRVGVFTYRTTRGNQKRYRDLSLHVSPITLLATPTRKDKRTKGDGKIEDETSTEHLCRSVSTCFFPGIMLRARALRSSHRSWARPRLPVGWIGRTPVMGLIGIVKCGCGFDLWSGEVTCALQFEAGLSRSV